jgi:hypothetical protein
VTTPRPPSDHPEGSNPEMSLVDHIDLHQAAPITWPSRTIHPTLNRILNHLEHTAATLPLPLALPAILGHHLISTITYR